MKEITIQLLTAFLGALGFSLVFNLRHRLLIPAALGGLINWGTYLLVFRFFPSEFFASFVAAAVSVIYSEAAAKLYKAPTTLFLVPSIIPAVPGSSLFYTMSSIAAKDTAAAKHFGLLTAEYTLAIAAGMCLSLAFFSIINGIVLRSKLSC